MNQLIAKLIHQPSTNLKTNLSTTTQSIKTNKLSLAFRLTLGLVLFSAVLIGINHQSKALAEVNNNYTWTQRKNGFVGDQMSWRSITSSADGTKLAAVVNDGSIYTSSDSGTTWSEQTAAGSRNWYSITSSADGTKLAAVVDDGSIYTSADSGTTWTEQTSPGQRYWRSITSSADGTKLAAVAYNGSIYTSADSGTTWTEQTAAGSRSWYSITSSADGTKLAAVARNGSIYTSTDSGATWTEQTAAGSRYWISIASSADGTKLAAVANGGSIYTSTDSGTTWTEQTSAGSRSWQSITSSADGTKLAAVVNDGSIYTSADSGVTWLLVSLAPDIYPLTATYASSNSQLFIGGAKIIDMDNMIFENALYTSNDNGQTLTDISMPNSSKYWISITSSADGTKLAAVVSGGSIYTGSIEGEVVDPPTPPPSSNTAQLTTPTSPLSTFSLKPVSLTTPTGTTINSSSTVPESSLVTQDNNNQYPLGLVNFSFTTNQSSNQVVLNFETDLKPNQVTPRKYNPNSKTYTNLPTNANVSITETTINNKHYLVLTYTIIDNGELDLDPAAGTISDPVGLAVSNSTYDQLASTGENTQPILLTAVLLLVSGIVGVWYFGKGRVK